MPVAAAAPRPAAAVRRRAALAAGAGIFGAVVIAVLHVLPAGRALNPMSEPISLYALTRDGWLFDVGVLGMALGLGALLSALVRSGFLAAWSAPFAVMAACSAGLVALVIFPDRSANGALTVTGRTHWVAAMLTFGGLALVPALIGHRGRSGCSPLPGVARRLSVTAASWFTMLLVGSILEVAAVLPTSLWRIGGLVERALAATEILLAAVLTAWAWRGCPCRPRSLDPG